MAKEQKNTKTNKIKAMLQSEHCLTIKGVNQYGRRKKMF